MQRFKKIFFAFTRKERVGFLAAAAVSAVSFVTVMGMLVFQSTRVVPAAGGDYTEGIVGQPEYVNPVTASTETDLGLVKMIYSNMYDIAEKISVSPDGRTWTVRLKENLRFQNREKLTSDDVIFTVRSIQSEDSRSPLYQNWQGVAVSRTSELELQFSLASPYAFFGDNLKNLYILPKRLFATTPPGNWRLSDYNLKPVGSGPYEFVSYEKRPDGVISVYHLKAWGDYPGTKPLIDHFDFKFFSDAQGLVKSFNAGQVDNMAGVAPGDLAAVGRPYDLFAWRTPSYYAVFFNQSKSLPLQDKAVREALSMAVDRDALVAAVLGGHGKSEYGPVPEGAPYFVPVVSSTSRAGTSTTSTASASSTKIATVTALTALDIASAALEAAGWKIGADGFRAKSVQKTSVPLAMNLTVPKIDFLVKTAQALQAVWQKLGVKVNITTDSPENIVGRTIKNRDYESLLFGNILGASSDLHAFWNSSQRFYPGLNLAIYQNKKVDALIAAARQNLDDASRAKQFTDAENLIAADSPAIFLYSPDYLYVTNKSIRGITPHFIASDSERFRDAGKWYLNTARVLK